MPLSSNVSFGENSKGISPLPVSSSILRVETDKEALDRMIRGYTDFYRSVHERCRPDAEKTTWVTYKEGEVRKNEKFH